MKRLKLQTIALLLIVSATFTSCLSDDIPTENISLDDARVTNVSGPDVAAINVEITLNLTYNVDNDCGHFNKFIETIDGNNRSIILQAYYDTSDCGGSLILTAPYKFKATSAGTYILKFKRSETQFITKTIVVS